MTPEEQQQQAEKEKVKKPSYKWPIALGALGAGTALAGGLLISPRMRAAAKTFIGADNKINTNLQSDPVKDLNTYVTGGSDMASGKIMGVLPVPSFMKGVRLSQFTPEQWRYWNPDTASHYTDFANGPASGYFRFLQEHVDSEKDYHTGRSLIPSLFNPTWWAKHKIEGLPGGDKHLADGATDTLLQNIQGMKGKYDPTVVAQQLQNKFKELAGVDDISKIPIDQQRQLFPRFDDYVKKVDPNLWKQKYLTDFTQGASRIPSSLNSYVDLVKPVMAAQNALVGGGAAIAGTAGAWALIKAHRAKKEEEKRKQQMLKGAGIASLIPNAIGAVRGSAHNVIDSILRKEKLINGGKGLIWPRLENPLIPAFLKRDFLNRELPRVNILNQHMDDAIKGKWDMADRLSKHLLSSIPKRKDFKGPGSFDDMIESVYKQDQSIQDEAGLVSRAIDDARSMRVWNHPARSANTRKIYSDLAQKQKPYLIGGAIAAPVATAGGIATYLNSQKEAATIETPSELSRGWSDTGGRLLSALSLGLPIISPHHLVTSAHQEKKHIHKVMKQIEAGAPKGSLKDTIVRAGGGAPIKDLIRAWTRENSTVGDKALGTLAFPGSVVGNINRADHLNGPANTVTVHGASPSILSHEMGHAIDFNTVGGSDANALRSLYGLAYSVPFANLWHEGRANQTSGDAIQESPKMTQKEKDIFESERVQTLPSAYSTYLTGNIARVFPPAALGMLPVAAGTKLVTMLVGEKMRQKAEEGDKKKDDSVKTAEEAAGLKTAGSDSISTISEGLTLEDLIARAKLVDSRGRALHYGRPEPEGRDHDYIIATDDKKETSSILESLKQLSAQEGWSGKDRANGFTAHGQDKDISVYPTKKIDDIHKAWELQEGGMSKDDAWSIIDKTASLSKNFKLVFYKNRSTPQVVKGDEEGKEKTGYGEVTGKRDATPKEVATIMKGRWLRKDEQDNDPKSKDYKKTKMRPHLIKQKDAGVDDPYNTLTKAVDVNKGYDQSPQSTPSPIDQASNVASQSSTAANRVETATKILPAIKSVVTPAANVVGDIALPISEASNDVSLFSKSLPFLSTASKAVSRVAAPLAIANAGLETASLVNNPQKAMDDTHKELEGKSILGKAYSGFSNPIKTNYTAAVDTGKMINAMGDESKANDNLAKTTAELSKTREGRIGLARATPLPSITTGQQGVQKSRNTPHIGFRDFNSEHGISDLPRHSALPGGSKVAMDKEAVSVLPLIKSLPSILARGAKGVVRDSGAWGGKKVLQGIDALVERSKSDPAVQDTLKNVFSYRFFDPKNVNYNTAGGALLGGVPSSVAGAISGIPDALRSTDSVEQDRSWKDRLMSIPSEGLSGLTRDKDIVQKDRSIGDRLSSVATRGAAGFVAGGAGGAAIGRYGMKPIQKGIGRVATNLFDPHIYDVKPHIQHLRDIGPRKAISSVIRDLPSYEIESAARGRDTLWRRFFNMKEREGSKGFLSKLRNAGPDNLEQWKFNARDPDARAELKTIVDARKKQLFADDWKLKDKKRNLILSHPNQTTTTAAGMDNTMGNFSVKPDGSYADTWDFAHNSNSEIGSREGIARGVLSMLGTPAQITGKTLSNEAALKLAPAPFSRLPEYYKSHLLRSLSHGANLPEGEVSQYLSKLSPKDTHPLLSDMASTLHNKGTKPYLSTIAKKENVTPQEMRVLLGGKPSAALTQTEKAPASIISDDNLKRYFGKHIPEGKPQEISSALSNLKPADKNKLISEIRALKGTKDAGAALKILGNKFQLSPEDMKVILG